MVVDRIGRDDMTLEVSNFSDVVVVLLNAVIFRKLDGEFDRVFLVD